MNILVKRLVFVYALGSLAGSGWGQESGKKFSIRNKGAHAYIFAVEESAAAAKPASAQPVFLLPSTMTVTDLATSYITAFRDEQKTALLDRLGQTRPRSEEDLRWLLNLYAREDVAARVQAEASLRRLTPGDRRFASFFTALLQDEDSFLRMFGMIGSFQIRAPEALPLLRSIAEKPFSRPQPTLSMPPTETNEWQTHYQALQTLALWEGDKALPLLEKRSREVPGLGALIATLYWQEYLPRIIKWSESSKPEDIARGNAAWRATVAMEKLRPTAPLLRQIVFDRKKKKETRHQAAIKLGLASTDEEIAGLLKDYNQAKDTETRLLLATTLFASRSPRIIPLLERYAKEDPSAESRAAALLQLREMLPRERYVELLKWVVAHETDSENRSEAARQLATPESP